MVVNDEMLTDWVVPRSMCLVTNRKARTGCSTQIMRSPKSIKLLYKCPGGPRVFPGTCEDWWYRWLHEGFGEELSFVVVVSTREACICNADE